jgi:hypothetical protein
MEKPSTFVIINTRKNSISKVNTSYGPNPPSIFYIPVHSFKFKFLKLGLKWILSIVVFKLTFHTLIDKLKSNN